jgi:cytochrome b6-f complex iron-sulfur subunit
MSSPPTPDDPTPASPAGPASERDDPSATLLGRRDAVTLLGLSALGTAVLVGAGTGLRSLLPSEEGAGSTPLPAGRPEELAPNAVREVELGEERVFLARGERGLFALSSKCPHLGCRLRLSPSGETFACACHGSLFSSEGVLLRGPAARSMERFPVALSPSGELLVDVGSRLRRERGEWDRPGALLRAPAPAPAAAAKKATDAA